MEIFLRLGLWDIRKAGDQGGRLAVFRIGVLLAVLFSSQLCLAQSAYKMRVGAVLPLSGSLAYVGEDIRRGVTLALEEFRDS